MAGQDSNDRNAEFLKQACLPAAASPEFKAKLRQRLSEAAGAAGAESPKPLWQQPFLWIPAATASAVALALVIYFVVFQSAPLTVTTIDASRIQTTAATLNANLDGLGAADSIDVSFEWGTTTDYGNETMPAVRTENGGITADLSGLAPNTTYHFRVKAVGRHGTVYGPDQQFTTGPAPPVATTSDAANIKTTSATLRGGLDSLGTASTVRVSFEWGLTTSYGSETTPESKTASGKYSADLDGLSPNTTYHFRAKAVGDDTAYGADAQFTTGTTAPSVATNDATNISTNSARLNGELSSLGTAGSVSVSFEWGLAQSYGNETTPESKTATDEYGAPLSGLSPNTTYHFRAKAVGHGTTYGADAQFTTGTTAPSVATNDATNISTNSARLNGELSSLGTASTVNVSFEYSTATGSYTHTTADQARTGGTFSADLTGLTPGTTYYYRAKAVGDGAPVYGVEKSFTTLTAPPSVTTSSATEVHSTSAMLNGIFDSLGTAVTVDVSFEWGLTTAYGNETASLAKTATGSFDARLTGLSPNITFHFRAKAIGDGVAYGADMTFTTGSTPPAQETWYLSNDVSGSVNVMYVENTTNPTDIVQLRHNGTTSRIWRANQSSRETTYPAGNWTVQLTLGDFEVGHTDNVEIGTWDGNVFTPHGVYIIHGLGQGNEVYVVGASISAGSFTVPSGGYVAVRITVTSSPQWLDVHVGGSQSYVTSPAYPESTAPTVADSAATSVEPTATTLNGSLDSLGIASSVTPYFEWGTTTDYGNPIDVGPGTSGGNFSAILANLTPNTTYHFRAKAVGDGTNYGVDMIFTTPP
jgi:hypothetical protein